MSTGMAEKVYYTLNLHKTGESITYEQYLKAKAILEAGDTLTMEMIE